MTRTPKATPITIEYTDEGEPITVVVTCQACGFRSYDEVYDICPKCFPPSDEDQ